MIAKKPQAAGDSIVEKALNIASAAHKDQKRASGDPYIEHPQAVADILMYLHADKETLAAALLHDTVEDTSVSYEDLEREFGRDVAYLVEGVTKVSKVEKSMIGNQQNLESIRKMFRAMGDDLRVIFIKLADRLHNMMTIEALPPAKQQRIARETQDIFCPLAELLSIRRWFQLLEDHSFKVLDAANYRLVKRKMEHANKTKRDILDEWMKELREALETQEIPFERVLLQKKNLFGVFKQSEGQQELLNHLESYYIMKVITKLPKDCYVILGGLHEFAPALPGSMEDFISQPKINGNQELHTALLTSEGNPLDVAILTEDMEQASEFGAALPFQKSQEDRWDHLPQWIELLISINNKESNLEDFIQIVQQEIFGMRQRVYVSGLPQKYVDLPPHASILDLAYHAGQPWSSQAHKAYINGTEANAKHLLQHGDVVEFALSKKPRAMSAHELQYTHTFRGQKMLIADLATLDTRHARDYGREYLHQILTIAMDPFFPVSWRKAVIAELQTNAKEYEEIGRGLLQPFSLIEQKGSVEDFFLLDPACFTQPGQSIARRMRYVPHTSLEHMRDGQIVGVQMQPDVVYVFSREEYMKERQYREETIPLVMANKAALDYPFLFALSWTFPDRINPLETIANLQEMLDTPLQLEQFDGKEITLVFRTDRLETMRLVYQHLSGSPDVHTIFRTSP